MYLSIVQTALSIYFLTSNLISVTIEATAAEDAKMCDNHNIARGHKMRNLTSNIFGGDDLPAVNRPVYDRKNMSNVF